MVEFYLLTFPRFPLRKKEHKSYFGKNRTHDFRTSRCAGYLLDHSGDEGLYTYMNHHAQHPIITQHNHCSSTKLQGLVLMSIIVPPSHTRIGAWVNSKMYGRNPLVCCTISLIDMQGYRTNIEYTGRLGYNSVCCITSRSDGCH